MVVIDLFVIENEENFVFVLRSPWSNQSACAPSHVHVERYNSILQFVFITYSLCNQVKCRFWPFCRVTVPGCFELLLERCVFRHLFTLLRLLFFVVCETLKTYAQRLLKGVTRYVIQSIGRVDFFFFSGNNRVISCTCALLYYTSRAQQ